MGLRELDILPAYETLEGEDPVSSFYIPALRESISYDRSVGYFSSASLALAARGIAGLIANQGGMRLIVSPHLAKEDIEQIRSATTSEFEAVELSMAAALGDVDMLADEIARDHVRALGWMLAKGDLDMRVAYIVDEQGEIEESQLFHQKVGIMRDSQGAALSFSGSINETASGWLFNSEEFKVFKSWDDGQEQFFESDEKKFECLWHNEHPRVRTFKPDGAFCKKLVSIGEGFELEHSALSRYASREKVTRISLFSYQCEAFAKWREVGGSMLFEMATGTGKTRTALACVQDLLITKGRVVCVVATPQSTLSRQWAQEVEALGLKFDLTVFADSSSGTSKEWAADVRAGICRIAVGRADSMIVFTTHKSASNCRLAQAFEHVPDSVSLCFVGDEVHGLGSKQFRCALLDSYKYRIGLSATPSRWFDDEGSGVIRSYFGDQSYEFTIRQAQETINPLTGQTFLCPYEYHLECVSLDSEEADEYAELSRRISRLSFSSDSDAEERLERLLMKRANIKKDAMAKLGRFGSLLREIDHKNLIVFTSPRRIDEVEAILSSQCIAAKRFTKDQGTRPCREFDGLSERDYLIRSFKHGSLQALVAIKCLDEGIDIPQAQTAVLLSSSTNPREYVQRVGRVIRRSQGKEKAYIYDFVVVPDWDRLKALGDIALERKLFKQELVRIEDMRRNALNSTDVLIQVRDLLGGANGN